MKKYSLLLLVVLVLSAAEAFAQIELLAAFPGKATSGYAAPPIGTRMDFTGDGVPDLVFVTVPSEFPVLIIQDGADPNQHWQVPLPSGIIAILIGFFEINHDPGFKEIVLAEKKGKRFINPFVLDIDGGVLWDGSGKELLTISNMERDFCDEDAEGPCPDAIVAGNPAVPQVEIWGVK